MFKGKTYIDYIEEFLQEMKTMNESLSEIKNELEMINGNGINVTIEKVAE